MSVPKAYKTRGEKIKKGMIVAVHSSGQPGVDWMADHPFWLAKVWRISRHHLWLHFLGDKFLEVYRLLENADGSDHIAKYNRKSITILHWNIKLVGYGKKRQYVGKLSAGDQRVLSLDARVPWCLSKHTAKGMVDEHTQKRKLQVIDPSKYSQCNIVHYLLPLCSLNHMVCRLSWLRIWNFVRRPAPGIFAEEAAKKMKIAHEVESLQVIPETNSIR